MRWPWSKRPTAHGIADAQETRLRNAREAAVKQERERILRGIRKRYPGSWATLGLDAKWLKDLIESK